MTQQFSHQLPPEIEAMIAKAEQNPPSDGAELQRLAGLSKVQYERQRKEAAKKLGVRASELDKAVKEERDKNAPSEGQGQIFKLAELPPWTEEVDGAKLLSDTVAMIQRYLVVSDGAAEILAVWAVHTHCYHCFAVSPRLAITSAEKGCGKTTCLDVLGCFVSRPLPTSNATVGAVFRIIELGKPSLLMDEADTFLQENDELRGILNTGHRRGGSVLRCVGDEHEPRTFSTWAPAAIAGIGKLPDTLEDRAVSCRMRRRKPTERAQSFRSDRTEQFQVLARKMARWATDHEQELRASDPDVGELQNRAADNWRPLLAIADVAGGIWPKRLRTIAAAAVAARAEQSVRVQLLIDIKAAFETQGVDKMSSEDLVNYLVGLEGHPWIEWKGGRPLTKASLARLLNPFETYSGNIRVGLSVPKGYHLHQFADAFERYVGAGSADTPFQNATSLQAYSPNDCSTFQNATAPTGVADEKTLQAHSRNGCSDVAVSNPLERQRGNSPALGPPGDSLDDFLP